MSANPTVTAEWLSSQVPSARLCLGTGPGDNNAVGTLDMRDLVKALVPRISSSESGTRYH